MSADPLRDSAAAQYESEETERRRLEELYLDDLRTVLETPEGRRVLFHWLDTAGTYGKISFETMERDVAVSNYGKDRVAEIFAASPYGLEYIMRSGEIPSHDAKEEGNGR